MRISDWSSDVCSSDLVVALAGALSDAGEHRIAAVRLGEVVDELLDQHRLANASAAEQTDLAAARVGRQQVDDLDDGDQHLGFGRLVGKIGASRWIDASAVAFPGPRQPNGSPITL